VREQPLLNSKIKFDLVYAGGRSLSGKEVVIRILSNDLDTSRFGFVASRRVGNAVVRNRIRRRLKEIARRISVKTGWDIVIIARVPAAGAQFKELNNTVLRLFGKAGLLVGANEDISHGAN
jgi:ribonuclease P protein component